jgi:tRNA threonylcarbamoyl adenosine modification protein YjeE
MQSFKLNGMDYNALSPAHQSAVLTDENATLRAGQALARVLQPGDCVLLHGDLGAGKTTFTRGILRAAAGQPIDVPSPTFTLVQSYPINDVTFYHYDLYRLPDDNNEQDLTEIGFFDALNDGIALVEWPERLNESVPPDHLVLHFTLKDDETRIVSWAGHGAWQSRAAALNLSDA